MEAVDMKLAENWPKSWELNAMTKNFWIVRQRRAAYAKSFLKNMMKNQLVMDTYSGGYRSSAFSDMPINYKLFLAQFNAIKNIAEEGPCVIVGRCADYALAEFPNLISVFIHGDLERRVERIASKYDLTNAKAKEMIIKTDKGRASYYNYYSTKRWGHVSGYDLCVNSTALGIDSTVQLLKNYIALKEAGR